MAALLGFDPGGPEQFGWCVVDARAALPLVIRNAGLANYAGDAVENALAALAEGEEVLAAAIDAPIFWAPSGDRAVDDVLRQDLKSLGSASSWGTVQHVNSLRGACLAQGMCTALLLREKYNGLPISESHPKAVLWLLGYAGPDRPTREITLGKLMEFAQFDSDNSEHKRDAAIAALSAWAAVEKPGTWRNLLDSSGRHVTPVEAPISYWVPKPVRHAAQPRRSSGRKPQKARFRRSSAAR